jgi:replicative DNA helicase
MTVNIQKLPAQNLEAEQAVLGAIMLQPDSLLQAADIIQPEDFYREAHRLVYETYLDLYDLGEPIELLTVIEHLKSKGESEKAGGEGYLADLATIVPTSANVRYHCRIVRGKATHRRVQKWATGLVNEALDGQDDIQKWFGKIERELVELVGEVREKRSPLAADIVGEIRRLRDKERAGKLTHIPTDYKLQTVVPGYYPGHLWCIGGYTSVGKSTLLAQLVADACAEGARVLIFSTEDSSREKIHKLVGNLSGVSQRRLIEGAIEGFEERVQAAEEQVKAWAPIIYDDVYSLAEMRLKVKKYKLSGGLDIVALDYIQNIRGEGNEYERLTTAIAGLQALAKELGVTVIVLSQVNNDALRIEGSELIGLKGSGALAAAPDIILWLKRVKGFETELDCEVRKNRAFGTTGLVKLKFTDNWTRIDRR